METSSPHPHSSSPRYAYSDDGSEHGDMDVDDDIDELLSDDPRGGDDRGDTEDEEGGDAGKTGQRECLWEGCGEVLADQAELVKHVQDGG